LYHELAKTLRRVLSRVRHTPAMAALKHLLNYDDEIDTQPVHHAPYWDDHAFLEEYVTVSHLS
jgi:ferredoxin-NADP reductase